MNVLGNVFLERQYCHTFAVLVRNDVPWLAPLREIIFGKDIVMRKIIDFGINIIYMYKKIKIIN